jgi:hypothetical protein
MSEIVIQTAVHVRDSLIVISCGFRLNTFRSTIRRRMIKILNPIQRRIECIREAFLKELHGSSVFSNKD